MRSRDRPGSVSWSGERLRDVETWDILNINCRYPVLRGLRLPEDEIINIKCKPQDRAVAGQNAINFQEAM